MTFALRLLNTPDSRSSASLVSFTCFDQRLTVLLRADRRAARVPDVRLELTALGCALGMLVTRQTSCPGRARSATLFR